MGDREDLDIAVRLADLESDAKQKKEDISSIKDDIKEIRDDQKAIYEISQSVSLIAQAMNCVKEEVKTVTLDVAEVKKTVNILENKPGNDALTALNDLKKKISWLIVGGTITYLVSNTLPYIFNVLLPTVCK